MSECHDRCIESGTGVHLDFHEVDMQRRDFIKMLAAATSIWPAAAYAQSYPSRPITMVVPFAAGGTFDVVGRIVATRMAELLGQSVVVENVTCAGGIVGVTRVIKAAPDGYTLHAAARQRRHACLQSVDLQKAPVRRDQ